MGFALAMLSLFCWYWSIQRVGHDCKDLVGLGWRVLLFKRGPEKLL